MDEQKKKENQRIQLHFAKDIFSDIKGLEVTNIRIGTYGLDAGQAHNFISQFKDSPDCNIQISYDKNNLHSDGESAWPIIYKKEGYLMGQIVDTGVYHPKYIIVEYKNNDCNICRIYISSMNMTKSSYCEVGIELEGIFNKNENNNQISTNEVCNGCNLADVLNQINDGENFDFLKKYKFQVKNDNRVSVSFYDGAIFGTALFRDLKSDNLTLNQDWECCDEIIIFSPFFSGSYVKKMCELRNFYFVSNRFSADWNDFLTNIKEPNDKILEHLFYWKETQEQSPLHGKLYIFRKRKKLTIYIGSANFSERALTGSNKELMVKLELNSDESSVWDKIKDTFEKERVEFLEGDIASDNELEKSTVSKRDDYNLAKVDVEVVAVTFKDMKWEYHVKLKSKPDLPEDASLAIQLYGEHSNRRELSSKGKIEETTDITISSEKAINALELIYSDDDNYCNQKRIIFIEENIAEKDQEKWNKELALYIEEKEKEEIAKYLLSQYRNPISRGSYKTKKESGGSTYKILLEDSYFEVISRVLEDEQDEDKREKYRDDILTRIRNVSNRKDELHRTKERKH
ncbi:MAG: restriction endonuclease PLD domain-containing protein [Lachnospiraceae bacterium]